MRTAVLIPAYKRVEYTDECLKTIYEAQSYKDIIFYLANDGGNNLIMKKYKRDKDILISNTSPVGLRNIIIQFWNWARESNIQYISKVDNDCLVPSNWLNDLLSILTKTSVDILSPNVSETNAAFKYGKDDTYNLGFRPSSLVGGLWTMKRELTDGIYFEPTDTSGIRGAFALLHQIIKLKEPRPITGWTEKVTFQDIGHWAGTHPKHIKSEEHSQYSAEVGRPVGWTVEAAR